MLQVNNKQAQAGALVFMLAIVVILLGLAFAPSVNEITISAMNETNTIGELGGMNCTLTTDNFVKAACWTTDIGQAYFIMGIIAIAGIIVGGRIAFG